MPLKTINQNDSNVWPNCFFDPINIQKYENLLLSCRFSSYNVQYPVYIYFYCKITSKPNLKLDLK